MAELDKDVDKAIDDHLKRIYDRYKTNTKVFNATHVGHIVAGVLFLFAVLLPFLFLQIDTHRTAAEMAALQEKAAAQEETVEAYRQAMAGMTRVFEAVKNTPKPLQGYIRALEAEADSGVPAPAVPGLDVEAAGCGTPAPDRDRWMECRIHAFMKAGFEANRALLEIEVAEPLARMKIGGYDQWRADLDAGIETLKERVRQEMRENPRFWQSFGEASPVYRFLVEAVNRFWETHRFDEILQRMEAEAAPLKTAVEELQKRQEENQAKTEVLENRLKNIKVGFGKFGLDVRSAILFAPIFLGAMFLVAGLNLAESIRLRGSFQRFFLRKDPGKTAITDEEFSLAVPLFLDPLAPEPKQQARKRVLLLPVVVFIATLAVVLYCWTIPETFPDMTAFDYGKFIFFYALSAAAFPAAFRRVQAEVSRYRSEPFEPEAGEGVPAAADDSTGKGESESHPGNQPSGDDPPGG
jgi:hypothetical protein